MKTNRTKLFAILFFVSLSLLLVGFKGSPVKVSVAASDEPAVLYKKYLCFACHLATASKNFDPTKDEAVLVETILKGKKSATPPNPPHMPGYETKPMTEDGAKAMLTYMKSLRPPAE